MLRESDYAQVHEAY